MINTLEQFIERCQSLKQIHKAYDLFEFESTDELRGTVYLFADPQSPEPFRSAMHSLGFTAY